MQPGDNEPIITSASKDKTGLDDSYRMIRLLGRGTMSSVYLAEQLSMARPVALKILSPALAMEPAFVERFLREAKASARLNHPNIVTAIDFGEVDNRYFLAMEYISGETLAALIEREAPLGETRVVAIGHQVVLALEHAAQHNVIHRDVKPANIMICRDGRVKLADFGLAILADAPGVAESSRRAVGTPYYMAPEQLEGGMIDWRADQCSLGASLYEAATGHKPFPGKTVSDVLAKRLFETPLPAWRVNRHISRSFSQVLAKMMARSPDDRYQSFTDLKTDFERLASGLKPLQSKPDAHPSIRIYSESHVGRRSTVVRAKVEKFTAPRRWSVLSVVSLAVVLLLTFYGLAHWRELVGPRPLTRPDEQSAYADPDDVSFAKYREVRQAWVDANQSRLVAETRPSTGNYQQAVDAMQRLADDAAFAGTVYHSMAVAALEQLRREAELFAEPRAPANGSGEPANE